MQQSGAGDGTGSNRGPSKREIKPTDKGKEYDAFRQRASKRAPSPRLAGRARAQDNNCKARYAMRDKCRAASAVAAAGRRAAAAAKQQAQELLDRADTQWQPDQGATDVTPSGNRVLESVCEKLNAKDFPIQDLLTFIHDRFGIKLVGDVSDSADIGSDSDGGDVHDAAWRGDQQGCSTSDVPQRMAARAHKPTTQMRDPKQVTERQRQVEALVGGDFDDHLVWFINNHPERALRVLTNVMVSSRLAAAAGQSKEHALSLACLCGAGPLCPFMQQQAIMQQQAAIQACMLMAWPATQWHQA